jgi:hypothetical protein
LAALLTDLGSTLAFGDDTNAGFFGYVSMLAKFATLC